MFFAKIRKIIIVLLLGLSLCLPKISMAFDLIEHHPAYANFIVGLIENSEISKNGTICTFGSDSIAKSILNQNKSFKDLGTNFSSKDLKKCKAIYVSTSMQKGLRVEMKRFNSYKILTIGIFDGFTESGGVVNVQLGRRNFELIVNHNIIKKSKIRLSALVSSLIIN